MAEVRKVAEKRSRELTLHARLGRQGKSAALGLAYMVDGLEVLRVDENDLAVAALRNLDESTHREPSVIES
jgi:hypothetical protein